MAIAIYRLTWFALMILVMAPAFIFAGSVDGISFREANWVVAQGLHYQFFMPWEMAGYFSQVIAFFAQLLPASSSVAVSFGEMIWEHIGVIGTFIFFGCVRPPVFSWMLGKNDKEADALLVGE